MTGKLTGPQLGALRRAVAHEQGLITRAHPKVRRNLRAFGLIDHVPHTLRLRSGTELQSYVDKINDAGRARLAKEDSK